MPGVLNFEEIKPWSPRDDEDLAQLPVLGVRPGHAWSRKGRYLTAEDLASRSSCLPGLSAQKSTGISTKKSKSRN